MKSCEVAAILAEQWGHPHVVIVGISRSSFLVVLYSIDDAHRFSMNCKNNQAMGNLLELIISWLPLSANQGNYHLYNTVALAPTPRHANICMILNTHLDYFNLFHT